MNTFFIQVSGFWVVIVSTLLATITLFCKICQPFLTFCPLGFRYISVLFRFCLAFIIAILKCNPCIKTRFTVNIQFYSLSFPISSTIGERNYREPILIIKLRIFVNRESVFCIEYFHKIQCRTYSIPAITSIHRITRSGLVLWPINTFRTGIRPNDFHIFLIHNLHLQSILD